MTATPNGRLKTNPGEVFRRRLKVVSMMKFGYFPISRGGFELTCIESIAIRKASLQDALILSQRLMTPATVDSANSVLEPMPANSIELLTTPCVTQSMSGPYRAIRLRCSP
jgi:hypothetical protein